MEPLLIFEFNLNSDISNWKIVNDVVMGGKSESKFYLNHDGNGTFEGIVNIGFQDETEKIISQIRDSTEGFTLVLAGLKAYLEHNIELNLILDRFPKELNE